MTTPPVTTVTGHVPAVAFFVTVGAVSQQVIKAEAQLGRPLFERTSKGLTVTASGLAVLARLGEGFQAHQHLDFLVENGLLFLWRIVLRAAKAIVNQQGFAVLVFPHAIGEVLQRMGVAGS